MGRQVAWEGWTDVERRQFIAHSAKFAAASFFGAGISDALDKVSIPKLSAIQIENLAEWTAMLRHADGETGARDVYQDAVYHTDGLVRLLRMTRDEATRPQIAMLVADACYLTGWLCLDRGDKGAAEDYYQAGVQTAGIAVQGDVPHARDLRALVAQKLAWALESNGHPARAAHQLDMLSLRGCSPEARALVYEDSAGLYARIPPQWGGGAYHALSALERSEDAEEEMTEETQSARPKWLACSTPEFIRPNRANTLARISRADDALYEIKEGLPAFPPFLRSRGDLHLSAARALFTLKEPVKATEEIHLALDDFEATKSTRLVEGTRELIQVALRRYDVPELHAVADRTTSPLV